MQPLCGQWPGETAPFLSPFAPLLRETPYAFAFLKAPRKRVIRNFLFCKRPRGKAASCKKLSTISTADPPARGYGRPILAQSGKVFRVRC